MYTLYYLIFHSSLKLKYIIHKYYLTFNGQNKNINFRFGTLLHREQKCGVSIIEDFCLSTWRNFCYNE